MANGEGFQIRNEIAAREAMVGKALRWSDLERTRHSLTASANGLSFDISWLEGASGIYRISPNPADYVFAQLKALTIDLPNRNLYNFSMSEMVRFEPSTGCQVHQTFLHKPTYQQHEQVIPNAKGVILGSEIAQQGGYSYVVLTTAWDRRKDSELCAQIGNPLIHTFYSMGCTAFELLCSVCGNAAPGKRNQCKHVHPPIRGTLIKGRLAYEEARKVIFNEESFVSIPADTRASRETTGPYTSIRRT